MCAVLVETRHKALHPRNTDGKIQRVTYLFALTINAIENSLISRLGETRLLPRLLVVLVASAETFGAEVEGIAERLVDACEGVVAGHEDLGKLGQSSRGCARATNSRIIVVPTRSDEVEACLIDRIPVQRP